jgi:polyhydroxyalkanoate synthesis repressor PhaR
MSNDTIRIKRYPNRRYYATHTSRYISLAEIEQLIRDGASVEIVDSQTGDDLTRTILLQIIAERHPDKIAMFPIAMLHSMLRANEVVSEFLQTYFRNALTYLEYLQRKGTTGSLEQPMHWMKTWLDNWPMPPSAKGAPKPDRRTGLDEESEITERITRLERRIAELEANRAQEN